MNEGMNESVNVVYCIQDGNLHCMYSTAFIHCILQQ